VNDKTFPFNKPENKKKFPDIFSLPSVAVDPVPTSFNSSSNVFDRANLLGFGETNKTKNGPPIFDPNDNPEFLNPQVPASIGQERSGFFTENITTSTNPYNSQFEASKRAVLFELPRGK
jgi:hypothetical protein